MRSLYQLAGIGLLCSTLSTSISAIAQPVEQVKYKIKWHGPKQTTLSAAYGIMEPDGTTTSKSFSSKFPLEMELTAPSSATVTASGTNFSIDTHVYVKIYRNGQLCDEAISYGKGDYATAFCSPPLNQGQ